MTRRKDGHNQRIKAGVLLLSLLIGLTFVQIGEAVELGEVAPDFTLPSTRGDDISLSQFLGKKNVVLEFYVLDFTPT